MKSIIYILLIIICSIPNQVLCQQITDIESDSISVSHPDSVSIKQNGTDIIADYIDLDTIYNNIDSIDMGIDTSSLPVDTSSIEGEVLDYKLSKDAISDQIKYGAIDSNWTSVSDKIVHLYGDAYINYQDINIKADYIKINFEENTVYGYAKKNEDGKYDRLPTFINGETEASFMEMKYNFNTKKAFVHDVKTNEGEFYLLGSKSKFISKDADSTYLGDIFYNQNALITTCNHPTPHFGIRTSKLKLVPSELAIVGPSQLELFGIPTPLILPFGFFPLLQGESSGLIFPKSYDYNAQLGFGFRDIG